MSDRESLKTEILHLLKTGNEDGIFLYNLCKLVNQPKKFVNSVLYDLRKNGLIQKVVESPPLWRIVKPNVTTVLTEQDAEMRSSCNTKNHGSNRETIVGPQLALTANRKAFIGIGRGTAITNYYQQQQQQQQTPPWNNGTEEPLHNNSETFAGPRNTTEGNNQMNNYTDAEEPDQEEYTANIYRTIPTQISTAQTFENLGEAILAHLRNFNRPTQTLELVSALGCANKKEVNSYLYSMKAKGYVKKVQDIPPFWQIASPPGGNPANNDSYFHRRHSQGPSAAVSTEYPVVATDYLKHNRAISEIIPTFNSTETKEAILKYLQMTKKPTGTLEIVSALGLVHKKVANPELYNLKAKGLVEKVQESPPLWQIKETPPVDQQDVPDSKPPAVAPTENLTRPKNVKVVEESPHPEPTEPAQTNTVTPKNKAAKHESNNQSPPSNEVVKGSQFSSIENTTPRNTITTISGPLLPPHELLKNVQFTRIDTTPLNSGNSGPELNQNSIPMLNNDNILSMVDDENSTNALGSLNMESFAALMKNPMSALHEYGQKHRVDAKIDIVETKGPSHQPMFKAAASIGDQVLGESWASTKKDAKRQAAELAVRYLVAKQAAELNNASKYLVDCVQEMGSNATLFDVVAGISHHVFNLQALRIPEYVSGRKVLATIVMQTSPEDKGTVVSFGTGNRCITGEHLNQEGLIINDSHAEVIARRGLLRFLYAQLQKYRSNTEHPLFEASNTSEKLIVRSNVSFHLYISTAPCGDGALFTRTAKLIDCPEPKNGEHAPLMLNNLQGLLRTKMEAGEGTIPVDTKVGVQAWDAILLGERLRTMSCSDKIARWNVIGLQGALICHFLEPVYLTSVTLGNLFHHGHISRALCCRLKGNSQLSDNLPTGFCLNHPKLGQISAFNPPRETEKTRQYSINWAVGDDKPELTNGVTGTCEQRFQSQSESRICKHSLFESFKKICGTFDRRDLLGNSYAETKKRARDFQMAKKTLFKQCIECGLGTWVQKPPEEEMFF